MTDEPDTDADENPHFDPDEETVTDAWTGAFIKASWGYNQTNAVLARIIDVSDSGKTVVAKLAKAETVDTGPGTEHVRPTADTYGDEFRLHVRSSQGDPAFRGSYPFVDGDKDNGTRREWFYPFSNEPDATVYQTAPNHGH